MLLRHKTLLAIALLLTAMILIINVISGSIISDNFSDLEEQQVALSVGLISSVIDTDIAMLDMLNSDYAEWDDSYEYIKSPNDEYIESNYVSNTFQEARLNAVLYLNSSGSIVYSKGFDLENNIFVPVDPQLVEIVLSSSLLHSHNDTEGGVTGIVVFDNGPMIISSRPITTSNGEGPISGTLLMARYLKLERIDLSSIESCIEIDTFFANDPTLPLNLWNNSETNYNIERSDGDEYVGYYPLNDVFGEPAIVFKTSPFRSVARLGSDLILSILVSMIIVGALSGLVILFYLDNNVLYRLRSLDKEVHNIGLSGDLSSRVNSEGEDELSHLSNEINLMLIKLEDTHEEILVHKARDTALLETIPDMIVLMKTDGTIVRRNYPQKGCLGRMFSKEAKNIFEYFPENIVDVCQKRMMNVANSKELGDIEYSFDLDGDHIDISSRLIAYGKDDVLAIISDNTRKKMQEEALISAKVAAENANKIKSEFLANISHELRTPLNSIIGFSSVLMEGKHGDLSNKQMTYASHINGSGIQLLDIVNDLLDISRIESGKMELLLEKVSIKNIMDIVKNTVTPLADKKNITIEIITEPDDLLFVADKSKILQIFYNLIDNAIKFTSDGGNIVIGSKLNGDLLDIFVKDSGIGISSKDIDKLFTPFMQLDASSTRKYGGTGIGLALVKTFTELHGGMINVDSELGKGSIFTITFPLKNNVVALVDEKGNLVK